MQGSVQKREISWAEVHDLFVEISDEFGFRAEDHEDDIVELITMWEEQGYVEIYQEDGDREYGRAKDSSLAPGAVPLYLNLFHARLARNGNDPLVALVFDEREEDGELVVVASLRFILDHDQMFGAKGTGEKFDREFMNALRRKVDAFIQQGDAA
ncbi:hypothetical protein ACNO7T_17755 [Vibrio campbellii]